MAGRCPAPSRHRSPSREPMSTPTEVPLPARKPDDKQVEIKIVSHSNLFYWWPVWAVGLLMGLLTLIDNHRMAVVPEGSHARRLAKVQVDAGGQPEEREVIVLPKAKDSKHARQLPPEDADEPAQPTLHMA